MVSSNDVQLLFRIRGDSTQAERELKNFTATVAEETAATEKSATGNFAKLKSSLSGLTIPTAAIAAGFVATATAAVTVGSALFALSQRAAAAGTEIRNFQNLTGLTAQSISTIKVASEAAGVSLDNFEEVWESFIEVLIEGGQGADDAKKKLLSAGIDPQKGFKDLEGSVQKGFDAIRNAGTQAEKSRIAMNIFGESGLNIVKVAEEMEGGFDKFKKKLVETGVAFDNDGVRKSKEFDRELKNLGLQAEGVGRRFTNKLLPGFTKAMAEISRILRENQTGIETWGKAVGVFVGGSAQFIRGLERSWILATEAAKIYFAISKGGVYVPPPILPPERVIDPLAGIEIGDPNKKNKSGINDDEKRAEEAKKRREEDLQGQQAYLDALAAGNKSAFGRLQEAEIEAFKTSAQTADEFRVNYLNREREFRERLVQITSNNFQNQIDAEPNAKKKKALRQQELNEVAAIRADSTKREQDAINLIGETQKKASDEKVKTAEQTTSRTLEVLQAEYAKREALLNQRLLNEKRKESNHVADIEKIKTDAIADEIAAQKKLHENKDLSPEQRAEILTRIAVLEINLAAQRINAANAVTEAINKETAEYEKQREELEKLRAEVVEVEAKLETFRQAQRRKVIVNEVENSRGKAQIAAIEKLRAFDIAETERQRKAHIERLDGEEKRELKAAEKSIENKETEEAAKLEIVKKYKALREEVDGEADAENDETKKNATLATNDVEPTGFADTFGAGIAQYLEGIALVKTASGDLQFSMETVFSSIAEIGLNAFSSIAQGFGQMVGNWVLYGNTGGQTLRKLAAQVLAQVATVATTYAIMSLAAAALATTVWGAALLGGTPGQFLAAAAIFGGIAVGSALVGRAVAGNSFNSGSGAGSRSFQNETSSGASSNRNSGLPNRNEPRVIEEGRSYAPSSIERREYVLRVPREMVSQTLLDDFNGLGPIREATLKMVAEG